MVNLWYVSQVPNSSRYNGADKSFRAMSRDPDTFKDPDRFIPERFLKNGVLREDVPDLMWGFGRRLAIDLENKLNTI